MSFIEISKPRPRVTLIRLNRPERMNAMAFDVMVPLRDRLREVSFDNDTRVVVLTGAGEGFSSGADHKDDGIVPNIAGLTVPTIARRALKVLDEVILSIRDMHQPVISAVNGAAIGGGFCLAVASDIRIAAPTACFRAAGINNGLTSAELGISYLLPRAIGSSRAFEIMLSGRDVDAEEADRLDMSLDIVAAVYADDTLAGWPGFGLAVQAYQKRATAVIDWLATIAKRDNRRLMVRLVKGAYWDSEIKWAQQQGLDDYPVFTRKVHTDVSYLACMRLMLAQRDAFYPQFATHNAHTIATALPVLRKADKVTVLTVPEAVVPGPSGAQLCDYLKYHGIEAGEVTAPPTGRKGGAAILEEADKIGADLLIKGAYTQSRLRQMILGGPTSYLLSHSHLPIFMEH